MSRPGYFKSRLLTFSLHLWRFWPPFIGAGISISRVEMGGSGPVPDVVSIETRLKLRFWNSNYVGTQFGGSLFAMADPFFMVILTRRLGRDFVVWDKSGSIRYLKPGRSDCWARFSVDDALLDELRTRVLADGKMDWKTSVPIKDTDGEVVAEVEKTIYIATRAAYEESRQARLKK